MIIREQHDTRNRVGRMRGMRSAGNRIDHLLRVPVIARDQHPSARGEHRLRDRSHTFVDHGDRLYRRLEHTCVPYHVRICKVHHDRVVAPLGDRLEHLVPDSRGAHLRLQVVGRHLWRRYKDTIFAGKGLFAPTVQKEGDMAVFFCFRRVKLG